MTSAKISGMVSTPGTLDTGLSKATGTVEKGLCATAQASFASVMEQKTSGYGNQQLTSENPVGKEPAATATQPAAVADSTKKTECKGEFSYTESGRAAESAGRHKGCI